MSDRETFAEEQYQEPFEQSDGKRLEWLMRHISGREFRRLGIVYSSGCRREDIDRAMSRATK